MIGLIDMAFIESVKVCSENDRKPCLMNLKRHNENILLKRESSKNKHLKRTEILKLKMKVIKMAQWLGDCTAVVEDLSSTCNSR